MNGFLRLLMTLCVISFLSACAGKTGERGLPGESIVGPTGPAGRDGVDATPTTIVKLCPGTASYPAVFIEVGLCLQGKLYGVYSANGGFLTLLTEGTYHSNAIGSACNFRVKANCVVEAM